MKKLLAILLTLAMLLSIATTFTACGDSGYKNDDEEEVEEKEDDEKENGENGENNNATAKPGTLSAAAEKLKTADSYTLNIAQTQTRDNQGNIMGMAFAVSKTTKTIRFSEKDGQIIDGVSDMESGGEAIYVNTEGYVLDPYEKAINKVISDVPFTLEDLLKSEGVIVSYGPDSVLGRFDALNPNKNTTDDGTTFLVAELTVKQWGELYVGLTGEEIPEEIVNMLSNPIAQATISPEGYLSNFHMQITQTYEGTSMNVAMTFAINDVNSTVVTVPEYAKNYEVGEGATVTYITNGMKAHYRCDWNYYDGETVHEMHFVGFGEKYNDEYTVETYTILDSIEGVPVRFLDQLIWNGNIQVKRLVIPAGVVLSYYIYGGENTTLFFEAPREAVDFGDNSESYFAGVYYAGEWSIVNGIPTPLN